MLTDIADYPPHFWIERQSQYVICGSRRAVQNKPALWDSIPDTYLKFRA